jgi:hypothetical protein
MTTKTNAERLRMMIAGEDEKATIDHYCECPGSALVPKTFAAMRVFLEAAHGHQYPGVRATGKAHPCRCWICMCVEEMIRAFEGATG